MAGGDERSRAKQAVVVFNSILGEMTAATGVLKSYSRALQSNKINWQQYGAVEQMCISFIVLGCGRFREAYEAYAGLIRGEDFASDVRAVHQRTSTRAMIDFRNQVVAHINAGDVVMPDEVRQRLRSVLDGQTLRDFLIWVNDPSEPTSRSLCGCCEIVRDFLAGKFQIAQAELGLE